MKLPRRVIEARYVRGKRVVPSAHNRWWYYRRLSLLTQVMDGRVRVVFEKSGEVLTLPDRIELNELRRKFVNLFDEEARPIAEEFFARNIRSTQSAFLAATKPIVEEQEKDARERKRKAMSSRKYELQIDGRRNRLELSQFREGIEENVNLIKTIPAQYFGKIDKAVEARTRGKMTRGALVKRIKELGHITQRRAEMIADDQTAKATEAMTLARCRNAGIKRVMWVHSGVSMKPRDYHKRRWDGHTGKFNGKPNGLNGYIFNIDTPPVIDLKTGERGFPAQLVNCKCQLVPVVSV